MNKKQMMFNFIKEIQNRGLLTEFIAYLFDYDNFHDYNYIFRLSSDNRDVIIDIYDNISHHRFNRYIFDFNSTDYDILTSQNNGVFVTKIAINKMAWNQVKLHRFAYLFSLSKDDILPKAKLLFEDKYLKILMDIINKPI